MELMELYNQIQNPINDPQIMEKLIEIYANSSEIGGFYTKVTKIVKKEYKKGEHYIEDADKFYSMMFNKWKNNIVTMSKDELYRLGYGEDFIKMKKYLETISDISTKEEANNIFFGSKNDKELEDALEKYRWTRHGEMSGWIHVSTESITSKKEIYPKIEHRLYLNTESIDIYKIVTYLVEKCDKYNLPYYFKFDEIASRDDTIVIYLPTENLTKYVEILREIKNDHPELIERIKSPSILTGKIDKWIGYGSHPIDKTVSYNQVRSKIIESSIDQVLNKWIMDHINKQIIYRGQKIKFQDYITIKVTENLIKTLEEKFISYETNDKKVAQKNGITYNQIDVINKLGYSLQDIKSPQFKQNIYKILSNKMETIIYKVCNNYEDVKSIIINVRNGKQISFERHMLLDTIKNLSLIAKNDKNFIQSVQLQIKDNVGQYGIDAEKFCFDIKRKERMLEVSAQIKEKQQQLRKIHEANQSKEQKTIELPDLNKKQNMNLETVDVQTLPQIINPSLMQKRMKLPNGVEIPAKQYIQEIVYPQLPSTGVIILKNGNLLSIQQFIEECVMFECQEKYNGDFSRYMTENTRNNIGVISFEYNDNKKEINPVEITNFINPTLLEKKMILPNGANISAKQYIQEYFVPHIPANGRITLSNGNNISVIQYIEEILMYEGQEKYNGDISKILFNTTRNNVGTVNTDLSKIQNTIMQYKNQVEELNKKQEADMEGGLKK